MYGSVVVTEHPLLIAGQTYEAIPRRTVSPQGVSWEYPYGEGIVIIRAYSAPGQETEYGVRPYETVWYSFEGQDKVEAVSPKSFLASFSRL